MCVWVSACYILYVRVCSVLVRACLCMAMYIYWRGRSFCVSACCGCPTLGKCMNPLELYTIHLVLC